MKDLIHNTIVYYDLFIIGYFLLLNLYYAFLLILAAERLFYFKKKRQLRICKDKDCVLLPSVAIITPAYNEAITIEAGVSALLKVNYPQLEIIIINDGSQDNTLEVLKDKFKLFPTLGMLSEKIRTKKIKAIYKSAVDKRLIVIDKENGGKADSLNVGINYSQSRLFCSIDSDSIVERDALHPLIQYYLEREAKIVALGGIVRIANGSKIEQGKILEARLPRKLLPAMQVMEYIRAFLCGRTGWSSLNMLLIISGTFGLFERKSVIETGGYRTNTVGEDMDIVIRLHKLMRDKHKLYKMVFIPDPVCWTLVPNSLKILGRQRNRWQRGLTESLLYNWKMLFNPRYGSIGLIGLPYFLFFEMLGPIIEFTSYFVVIFSYLIGWLNLEFLIMFLLLAIVFGVFLSIFSFVLEEFTVKRYENTKDIIKLLFLAILENFGYRQINSWWRFKALIDLLLSKKEWGKMERSNIS